MSVSKIRNAALAVLSLVLLFILTARSFMPGLSAGRGEQDLNLMERIIKHIRDDYIDRVEADKTMRGAFRGLVQALDPLSSYLDRNDLSLYQTDRSAVSFDPGIILIKENGGMARILALEEARPAEKSDLRAGDYLSAVDDESTLGLSLEEIRLRLKSREEKPVRLRIVRQTATVEIEVPRSRPPERDVHYALEAGTAGVLSVRRLSEATVRDAKNVLPRPDKMPAAPLVLDLRFCAEGEAESARRFLNLFLKMPEAGSFVARDGSREPVSCPEDAAWERAPLVVWIGPATMGPAEIVAASLQFARRANIIGRPTRGLAAKQTLFPLDDGSALLLTTSVFVLPSGERIWEKGVTPDVDLEGRRAERIDYLRATRETAGGR